MNMNMKLYTSICVVAIGLASLAHAQTPQTQPRLSQLDFTYLGAFRVPNLSAACGGSQYGGSYGYGGNALSVVGPGRLALVGHDHGQCVGEFSIPTPSTASSVGALPTASNLVTPRDILNGQLPAIGVSGQKIGGLLRLADGSTVVSAYVYYDAGVQQILSHFKVAGSVSGPYQVGSVQAGFVSAYMTPIPSEWQSLLGGTALTGNSNLSIIRRTSLGPSATVFTPEQLSSQTNAKMVLGYPLSNPTLGGCNSNGSQLINCAALFRGMVFPSGTRSVMFFGRTGTTYCYGDGVGGNPGAGQCLDPSEQSKGEHGYPYQSRVFFYDANDLLTVKNGTKQPWEIVPYATWTLNLPFSTSSGGFAPVLGKILGGAAFDESTRRLYVSAWYQDGVQPLVHVWQLGTGGTPPPVQNVNCQLGPMGAPVAGNWMPNVGSNPPTESRTVTATATIAVAPSGAGTPCPSPLPTTATTETRPVIVVPPPPPAPSGTPTGPAGFVFCVLENNPCNFTGPKEIVFGANGTFTSPRLVLGNGTYCNQGNFGDPTGSSVADSCFIRDVGGPTPPPVNADAVVSAWSAWTGGAWSTCIAGSQTRTETRTRTVVAPATGTGATPPLSETQQATQACAVPPPIAVTYPTTTQVPTQVRLSWTVPASPDGTTGWTLSLRRNGATVTSATSATVTCGNTGYTWRWSKSGQATRDSAAFAVTCP